MTHVTKLGLAALVSGAFLLSGCDVDKTQEGQLPDVDVSGGQLPQYDVQTPDVDVTTQERTVTVPDVDVNTQERQITVPEVNVTPAGE